MAIKVKHEGSVASRVAASASGGEAKRAMDAAVFAKGKDIVQKQAAHASAGGAGTAHAQLIGAPGGSANAPTMSGGGGIGASSRSSGSGGSSQQSASTGKPWDGKITGFDRSSNPNDGSVWNNMRGRWERDWLPGEKEAESAQRIMSVNEAFAAGSLYRKHYIAMDAADKALGRAKNIAGWTAANVTLPSKGSVSDAGGRNADLKMAYDALLKTSMDVANAKRRGVSVNAPDATGTADPTAQKPASSQPMAFGAMNGTPVDIGNAYNSGKRFYGDGISSQSGFDYQASPEDASSFFWGF